MQILISSQTQILCRLNKKKLSHKSGICGKIKTIYSFYQIQCTLVKISYIFRDLYFLCTLNFLREYYKTHALKIFNTAFLRTIFTNNSEFSIECLRWEISLGNYKCKVWLPLRNQWPCSYMNVMIIYLIIYLFLLWLLGSLKANLKPLTVKILVYLCFSKLIH